MAWTLFLPRGAAVTALMLLATCASSPTRTPPLPSGEAENRTASQRGVGGDLTNDECKTVLDCMRARGIPPAGLKWTCHLGLCAAEFASP